MWIDDDLLRRCHETTALSIWVPSMPIVVLGSSNVAAVEVDVETCGTDKVEILKRYGGGGTVVLHPGCVVVSIGTWVRHAYQNKLYFDLFNRTVIEALARQWPELGKLGQQGLSDITMGARKVAGTSLFRSRNYALYQASILVDVRLPLIERYLRHPSREPDYRQGRRHSDFLMGLGDVVTGLTPALAERALIQNTGPVLTALGREELIDPQPSQFQHLLQRAAGQFG